MCHPGDQEYMSVDKTWGIMPPSSMYLFVLGFYLFTLFDILTVSYCSLGLSKSHTWGVELLGEDFHNYQAVREVMD